MANKLLALVLITGILLQVSGRSFVLLDYTLNKNFISTVLCENRDKPQMRCNGKCHLKKQLKEQDKKESAPVNSIKEKYEVQFLYSPAALYMDNSTGITVSFTYSSPASERAEASIFHPPRA
jgi:hypothetical protein